MRNHQIPTIGKDLLDWLLQMPLRIGFTVEQIATPSIVAMPAERITHTAAVFAGD
jgi:hypothetical protein